MRKATKRLIATGLVVAVGLPLALAMFAGAEGEKEHQYIGVKKCKMCHKSEKKGAQFAQWEKSEHAKAFEVLATDEAKKIAKEKGIDDPQKSDKCVKCHVTGHGLPETRFAKTFKKEDGVQCETCHGPGSDYKPSSVMKDREKSLANGLILPNEEMCKKCHNEESPHFKGFCFAHYYPKVTHPHPGTKGEARVIKCTCDKKQDLKIAEDGSVSF